MRAAPELISVIIPVLNGEAHLGEQLDALASQTYAGAWEVVVVDNGCTDGSLAVVESRRGRLPSLRVADATGRRGINHARNVGTAAARGDFLAFCDADDVATPGWLEALAEAAPAADIVGGFAEVETLSGAAAVPSRTGSRPGGLRFDHDFLHRVSGGNCGMWTSVARALGWDETFAYASSDIEFSWRAGLASYRLAVSPNALMRRRHRHGLRELVGRWYLYGKSDAQLFRRFRERGMPRSSSTTGLREWAWLLRRSPYLVRSPMLRRSWLTRAARAAGRLAGSIRYRVFFP